MRASPEKSGPTRASWFFGATFSARDDESAFLEICVPPKNRRGFGQAHSGVGQELDEVCARVEAPRLRILATTVSNSPFEGMTMLDLPSFRRGSTAAGLSNKRLSLLA
jgi:hypothetical protein